MGCDPDVRWWDWELSGNEISLKARAARHPWRGAKTKRTKLQGYQWAGAQTLLSFHFPKREGQWEGVLCLFCLFSCHFYMVKWRAGSMKTVHTIIKTIKDLKKEDFLFLVYSQSFSNFLFCCHWSLSGPFVTFGLKWKKSSGLQRLQQLCSCHTCAIRWFVNDSKDCWFEGGL